MDNRLRIKDGIYKTSFKIIIVDVSNIISLIFRYDTASHQHKLIPPHVLRNW